MDTVRIREAVFVEDTPPATAILPRTDCKLQTGSNQDFDLVKSDFPPHNIKELWKAINACCPEDVADLSQLFAAYNRP